MIAPIRLKVVATIPIAIRAPTIHRRQQVHQRTFCGQSHRAGLPDMQCTGMRLDSALHIPNIRVRHADSHRDLEASMDSAQGIPVVTQHTLALTEQSAGSGRCRSCWGFVYPRVRDPTLRYARCVRAAMRPPVPAVLCAVLSPECSSTGDVAEDSCGVVLGSSG